MLLLPILLLGTMRLVVIERGESGFGVVCNDHNIITGLKGPAAEAGVLHVGDAVLEVDGEPLEDGERLIDRIRARTGRESFTLGVVPRPEARQSSPPSLNQIMKGMMASPQFKKMATKMVVSVVSQSAGSTHQNMLEGSERAAMLGAPNDGADRTPSLQARQSEQQLAMAQQQRQQLEEHVERQVSAILESDAFGGLVDKVTESPGIQKMMHEAEQGNLCAHAEGFHAVTACLLDGGLLRTVTDATCEAAGAGRAECEQVHQMTSSMLSRLGLRGDGWTGWVVRQLILRPRLAMALELCTLLLLVATFIMCLRRAVRLPPRRDKPKGQARQSAAAEGAAGDSACQAQLDSKFKQS